MKQKYLDLKQQLERLEDEIREHFNSRITFEGFLNTAKPKQPRSVRHYIVYDNEFVFIDIGCWDDGTQMFDLYKNEQLFESEVEHNIETLVNCLICE